MLLGQACPNAANFNPSSHSSSGLENKSRFAHAAERHQSITVDSKSYFESVRHRKDTDQVIMETSQTVDAPDWVNLYTSEPLTSIRQFVVLRPGGDSDIGITYMHDVAVFVESYWDEMPAFPVLLETTNRCDDSLLRYHNKEEYALVTVWMCYEGEGSNNSCG